MGTPVTLVDANGAPVTLTDPQGGAIPLGSMAPQDADNVAITGGSIAGITDLAIADGGTGASTVSGAQTNLGIGRGTSFPGSPAANDTFRRTDRNIDYYYDGTRWLSAQWGTLMFGDIRTSATSLSTYAPLPYFGTYSLWLEALDTTTLRTTALPDEWDIILTWLAANAVATTITTIDGSADPQNTYVARSTAIGAALDANARALRLTYSEIDDGGSLVGGAALRYRLIG